ncbi:MAG: hypothetical protein JSV04_03480 [Candidatus Heimdallarchaeota archaeon]|nr:MAG: hypothetical protein JSV04_03480 [Candidatus Heimdallarchaeota archaeon]
MTQAVSYWVAAHLTGLFEIKDKAENELYRGSRGAGVSISRGVTTTIKCIKSSKIEIFFNGVRKSPSETLVTNKVVELLLPQTNRSNLRISHNFEVPLSSGYGASAAGAIGTAFALNTLLELGLPNLELFQVAHKAEVLTKSGLGDVIGLYQGGLEVRLKEGAPGIGSTIPLKNSPGWKIATVHFGSLSTSLVLSNPQQRKAVNDAGSELISKLISRPYFDNFIELSAAFTKKVKLWSPQLKKSIENLPPTVIGSQIMLGEAFFVFYHDKRDLVDIKIPKSQLNKETICQNTILRRK